MSFSAGTYSLPGPALNTGDTVSATENNTFRNDVATAFNLTWLRNGTATATANLPMGGFKLTGLGDGSASGQALVYGQTTDAVLSGNLGLGVTPSAWGNGYKALQVTAGAAVMGDGNNYFALANSYFDGTNFKYIASTYALSYKMAGGIHSWNIAPSGTAGTTATFTQAMTLDASGNLLVGTTTAPNATFISKTNFIGLQTSNPADSTKWRQMVFANNSADATLYFPNGTNTATLSSAGAWTNASDARQKTNIVEIKYGLNTVLASQPHSYNRTDVDGDFIGFVAQELKEVIPEVVFGSDETSYSVDYGSLVAVAFKAIQEQQAIIQQLQADIAAKDERIQILENYNSRHEDSIETLKLAVEALQGANK